MKRDFSNSTRQILMNLLDSGDLFTGDIDYNSMFGCSEEASSALESYITELDSCIDSANGDLLVAANKSESLKAIINAVFDSAQQLDAESATKVETDATVAMENYLSDLQTLVNAISVGGLGDSREEILCNLGKYDSDGVFGDPSEFSASLSEVNDPSKEVYDQLILPNGDVDFEAVEELLHDESLEPWELKALAAMVDEKLINPDGSLNEELFEKFLACGYEPTRPGVGGEYALHDTYYLTDGYHEFAAYYNQHTNYYLQSYEGNLKDAEYDIKQVYQGHAVANAIIYGVDTYYDELYLPEAGWDGSDPVFMDLNFNITESDDGWLSISVDNAIEGYDTPLSPLEISGFGDVDDILAEDERHDLQSYYVDPNMTYEEALANGYYDMFAGNLMDGATGLFDDVPGVSQVNEALGFIMDVNEIEENAAEAKEEQEEKNEQYQQQIDASTYESILNNANSDQSSCWGVVVSQGDSYTIVDQHYSSEGMQQNLNEYNAYAQEHGYQQLTEADFHNAVYNPGGTDLSMFDDYLQWAKQ